MKRVLAALVLGCLGLLVWGVTQSLGKPEAKPTVVVGVEQFDDLPLLDGNHGHFSGFAREVFDLFGQRRGYTIQYRGLPIPDLYHAFFVDQSVDLKFPDNPVWMTPLRKSKRVYYSNGVVDFIDGVMVKPDRQGGHLEMLQHMGTIRGFDVGSYQERMQDGKLHLEQVDEVKMLLESGLIGRLDGVYLDVAIAVARLKGMGRANALVFDPHLPHHVSSYLVSSVKRPDLVREFNDFLIKDKPAIDALKHQYGMDFVPDVSKFTSLTPQAPASPSLPGGSSKQPLLTLCHDELPPYATGDSQWITGGIKFQLTRDILSEAGLRLRVLQLPWSRCLAQAAAGRVDGILPTFKTPERESKYLFSAPVLTQEASFFYLRQQFPKGLDWEGYEDLRGNRLGMILGGIIDPQMERTLASGGLLERSNDLETLMKMLHHKRLDLVAVDRDAGLDMLNRLKLNGEVRATERPINRQSAYLALSRHSSAAELMPRINQAIERMRAAGRLERPLAGSALM